MTTSMTRVDNDRMNFSWYDSPTKNMSRVLNQ